MKPENNKKLHKLRNAVTVCYNTVWYYKNRIPSNPSSLKHKPKLLISRIKNLFTSHTHASQKIEEEDVNKMLAYTSALR